MQDSGILQTVRKFFLSAFVVITFAAYVLYDRRNANNEQSPLLPAIAAPQSSQATPAAASAIGQYRDGEYEGGIAETIYGEVQVKAIIQNGNLTDLQFLHYPHERSNSVTINIEAVPTLRTEAIQAQSAQVDIISGATLTSRAFIESLQSALDQAKTDA